MAVLGLILLVVGMLATAIGSVWFLVAAFRESVFWGFGCMCVPVVSLIFLIMHWQDAKTPFGVQIVGAVIAIIGVLLGGIPEPA